MNLEEIAVHYKVPKKCAEVLYDEQYEKVRTNYPHMAQEFYKGIALKNVQRILRENRDICEGMHENGT